MNAFLPRSLSWRRGQVVPVWLAFLTLAASGFAAAPAAADAKATLPIISTDEGVRRELTTLDGLLMNDPKLEETLRTNLDQLTQQKFRENNPDVAALLSRQPGLLPALKTERHFLIHRSLARLARARVTRPDVIALDGFLTEHPTIAKALAKKPAQIVDADFLIANPALAKFFEAHPALSSVLEARAEKNDRAKPPAAAK